MGVHPNTPNHGPENDEEENGDDMSTVSLDESEVIVVMDGYGGEWTPSAAFTDPEEAGALRSMLENDAEAVCSITEWYESKDAVKSDTPTPRPESLPEEIAVCFQQDTALAVSSEGIIAREMQIQDGGLRGTVPVYETASDAAEDKPVVTGKFIDAEDGAAEDFVDSVR